VAIKPITDKQLIDKQTVNRETQTSQKNINTRGGGNKSQKIIPGIDLSKQYSITLKDIDSSVFSYIKDVIRPTVQEASEQIKVTVMYGNEERWKSVRKRGVMRDNEQNNTYWGKNDNYKFISTLDSISDASEMNQDGERFIKSTFSVVTKAYLLPEETNSAIMGKVNQVQKRITPGKVIFGFEGDATDEQIENI
jgi:hypothetical protein